MMQMQVQCGAVEVSRLDHGASIGAYVMYCSR
jgi:hypothetical protein